MEDRAPLTPSDLRILIADDQAVNQFILEKMLKKRGVKADFAFDGERAVELFQRNAYHLVFLDVFMPIMDGCEASKRIRAINSQVPIVAITAAIGQNDRAQMDECGMTDLMGKPFLVEHLCEMIERYTGVDIMLP